MENGTEEAPIKEEALSKLMEPTDGNSDDSGWDTDLESECDPSESVPYDVVQGNKEKYKQACKEIGIVPASYFLRNMTNQHLKMAHHGLGEKGAKAISIALMTNTHLMALDLADNSFGSDGTGYICDMLIENCFITELDLSENTIGFDGVQHICTMLTQIDSLKSLSLRRNSLSTKSAILISEILKGKSGLKHIDLSQNSFGEEAGLHLASAIALNEYLEEINLSWNQIRLKGAFAIAKALRENITLKKLDLSWNGFGDDGIYVLSESLALNGSLEEINLGSNRISHIGATYLQKGLKVNEGLHVLKIGNNPMQHGTIFILQAVKSNPNSTLKELDFTDIQVNEEFMELLKIIQQENCELKVYHGGLGGAPQKKAERPKPMKILRDYIKNNQMRVFDFFSSMDKDKSMSISIPEFVRGLKETGVPLRHDELLTLVRSLDLDGDGEIDYKELVIGNEEMKREERNEKLKDKAAENRKKKLSRNLKPSTPTSSIRITKVFSGSQSSSRSNSRPGSSVSTGRQTRSGDLSEKYDSEDEQSKTSKRRSKTFTNDTPSIILQPPSTAPANVHGEWKQVEGEKPPKTS